MRVLSLFLSLILLLIGLFSLLFVLIPSLIFHWHAFLFLLAIAVIVYLITYLVGLSLNGSFNQSVTNFIIGNKNVVLENKMLLPVFGFLLVNLLPFLIYLELFALYSAVTFSLYILLGSLTGGRVYIAVVIGIAIVVLGTIYAVVVGMIKLLAPVKHKSLGIEIDKGEQKKLWSIIDQVASETKTKPITKVYITPQSGIAVYLDGNTLSTLFGGGKRVLEIGIQSLRKLSVSEFKSILAHEYGHFNNADTQWSAFTYSMGNSLISALEKTPGPNNDHGGCIGFIVSLNPAFWILYAFVFLYFRITNGFSRLREVMADVRALKLYGGNVFKNALLKVAANDYLFNELFSTRILNDMKNQINSSDDLEKVSLSEIVENAYNAVDPSYYERVKNIILSKNIEQSPYDSHPSLKTRITYSERFEPKSHGVDDGTEVISVIENYKKLQEDLTILFLMYLSVISSMT